MEAFIISLTIVIIFSIILFGGLFLLQKNRDKEYLKSKETNQSDNDFYFRRAEKSHKISYDLQKWNAEILRFYIEQDIFGCLNKFKFYPNGDFKF